jgi:hypothetical protein
MKNHFIYLFTSLALLLVSIVAAQAQIPTTQISGTQTYTSISNIDVAGSAISGIAVTDMINANVYQVYALKKAFTFGIDATYSSSVANATSVLTNEPNLNDYSSIIVVKVYSYDKTKSGAKGDVIFGMYSTQTTTAGSFAQNGWKIYQTGYSYWPNVLRNDFFISNKIEKGAAISKFYYTDNADCQPPAPPRGWLAKAKSYFQTPSTDEINYDCFLHKGKEILQPVIVEITVKNATLRAVKIRGIDIINAQWFPIQTPAATASVDIKGSNYEINTFQQQFAFGHKVTVNSTDYPNRFTVSNVSAAYLGAKFTGLFGSGGSTNAYLKASVKSGQELLVALENGQTLTATSLGSSGFTPTLATSSAFAIKDAVDGISRTFNIWKVASTSSNRVFKFTANRSGPFIIANAFDVNFKENLALPANKRKLFHRADWLNDVLVCAHRGLWNKTGQPGNGSDIPQQLSGIAENTIAAYNLALNNPYIDWIEYDARRTKDGVFIAWHDDHVRRVSNFADTRECVPIDEVTQRTKPWYDEEASQDPAGANSRWSFTNAKVTNLYWDAANAPAGWQFGSVKDLNIRDYLGCEVKDGVDASGNPNGTGNFLHPLKISDGFDWLVQQQSQGKYSIISLDFKDGLNYLHELFQLAVEKDLEGQVLLSVYAKDYSIQDYQNEYGVSFLRQFALKPTFYEPNDDKRDEYGGDLNKRLTEYVDANNNGHFVAALTININNDQDDALLGVLNGTPAPYPADKIWYVSHYYEPFMASIADNNQMSAPAECKPSLNPGTMTCANLFWRADFDWFLNNGTNGIFSDNVEPLIEYLIAKGRKTRIP